MKKATDLNIPFLWAERRPVLLDRFFYIPGYFSRHEECTPIFWADGQIFGNDHSIYLEFCSGNGQWICERAQQHPQVNWVAVEKRFDRSRKIWLRLHRMGLKNLYVVCSEACIAVRYHFPHRSVAKVFVNFPDPWPKLRHAKHRLIQAPFLQELEKLLIPGGFATVVTDDFLYAEQTVREFTACAAWGSCLPPPYYALNPSDYGHSFFSDLWQKKGRNIYLLSYVYK